MKIMKHLLLILVGGILLNACSDDREMDDGRWKASALRVPLEVSSAVIKQEVVTRGVNDLKEGEHRDFSVGYKTRKRTRE